MRLDAGLWCGGKQLGVEYCQHMTIVCLAAYIAAVVAESRPGPEEAAASLF